MHLCLGTTPTVQQTMLFNHVEVDEVNRAIEIRRNASGKPVNVCGCCIPWGSGRCCASRWAGIRGNSCGAIWPGWNLAGLRGDSVADENLRNHGGSGSEDRNGTGGRAWADAAQEVRLMLEKLEAHFAGPRNSIFPSPSILAFGSEAQARRGEGQGEGLLFLQ